MRGAGSEEGGGGKEGGHPMREAEEQEQVPDPLLELLVRGHPLRHVVHDALLLHVRVPPGGQS